MEIGDVLAINLTKKVQGGAQQMSDWPEEGNQGLPGGCRSDLRDYEALTRQKDLEVGKLFIPRPKQLPRKPENEGLLQKSDRESQRSLLSW